METEKELNAKILAITLEIQEKHPELSKYLKEMPVKIPNDNKPEISAKILEEYYQSLINILKKHSIEQLNPMTTVSEVLSILREKGYTVDFNLKKNHLLYGISMKLNPGEFVVDKHYRFEGPSDPGDEAIVYAISSPKYNLKGVLVNGYGTSSDSITNEMIKALDEKKSLLRR